MICEAGARRVRFYPRQLRGGCEAGAVLPNYLRGGCEAGAVLPNYLQGGCEAGARRVWLLPHYLRGGCEAGAKRVRFYFSSCEAGARRVRFSPRLARRVRGGCDFYRYLWGGCGYPVWGFKIIKGDGAGSPTGKGGGVRAGLCNIVVTARAQTGCLVRCMLHGPHVARYDARLFWLPLTLALHTARAAQLARGGAR